MWLKIRVECKGLILKYCNVVKKKKQLNKKRNTLSFKKEK
ncbi:hypothetical protein C530_129 [Candidatus Portiera aleyrodidarum BT-B-HRs]|nr:hypothetical protein C548_127 [Candidatus Portiera aleyrodidarum BT-QVLC]AFT80773.1 hypothetical protein C530_129 [Candidatus Portiera aleyrodidarum BT-B-HRs]